MVRVRCHGAVAALAVSNECVPSSLGDVDTRTRNRAAPKGSAAITLRTAPLPLKSGMERRGTHEHR